MLVDFNIDNEPTKKKKKSKSNKLLIILSMFFLVLSITLLSIYFYSLNKPPKVEEPKKVIKKEKPKLNIFNEISNQRPIAIMIDNNIGDAYHAGLQDSFINYEIIVEGGLTRIMALYKDKDVNLIGPVRSSRHYFLDYALEYDAVYAHFGWSPYAERDIPALGINNINGMTDPTAYERDPEIAAPHNVFTSTAKLRSYLESKQYNPTSNNWKNIEYSVEKIELNKTTDDTTTENPNLLTASRISIEYSNSENRTYAYDELNEYYLRSQNGNAHIDRETDEQLHYKNIIIQKAENKNIDNEGRQDVQTTGTGDGFYITNGYALPIKWSKSTRNSKTSYTFLDGNPIKLNDGNTFIQIVPLTSNITIN